MPEKSFYYSKLFYSPETQGKDIGFLQNDDVYEHHRFVWRIFNENDTQKPDAAQFLYRIDYFLDTPVIYVLSRYKPESQIKRWQVQTKVWQPGIVDGAMFQFSLRANPTIGISGKRHDVFMHVKKHYSGEDQFELRELMFSAGKGFLQNKAKTIGIEFLGETLDFSNKQKLTGVKHANGENIVHSGKTENAITISTVDYQGVFRVVDQTLLLQNVLKGIGRAKRFGCGLMLLNRIA